MKEYSFVRLDKSNTMLVVIHTCESPFDYLTDIATDLIQISFSGTVIFDELLHSGNNSERFISCQFEKGEFDKSSFQFMSVKKQDELRRYIGEYLRQKPELLRSSGLTSAQIKLVEKKCVI